MLLMVVIPAYNEEKTVGEVVAQISNFQFPISNIRTIVVDDGSTDGTARVARQAGAIVLAHLINRGLGAALATGIEGALRLLHNPSPPPLNLRGGERWGVIVTLDADGQHDSSEIARVIAPIARGEAEVVIGTRFKGKTKNEKCIIPWSRRAANFCGNFFTWLLFGLWVSDSQSGFRAFSVAAAQQLRLRTSTMEVSSEIIREIARLKLRWTEVPISVRYTEYSLSKGQGFFRGLETLGKLVALKFLGDMLIQFLVTSVALIVLLGVLRRLRRGVLSRLGVVVWVGLWVATGAVVWVPQITNRLAGLLSVGRGADAVFYIAIVALLGIIFRLYGKLENLEQQLSELVKKIALKDLGK